MVLVRQHPARPSVRFSLVSSEPLPPALLGAVRTVFLREFGEFTEQQPRIRGLDARTFFAKSRYLAIPEGLSGEEAARAWIESFNEKSEQLRTLAGDAGATCALTTGKLAENGPKLIVTDVDSTFIASEVIELLAAAAGTEEEVREITERAMRGELDFADSLRERVATLEGIDEEVFARVADAIDYTPGALALVDAVHAHDGTFCLVSGGFHEVCDTLAERSRVDALLANRLEVLDGRLTGRVAGGIVDREAKAHAVKRWAKLRGYDLREVVVAGDGANDLAMMHIAGLSVAFCAKPIVAAQADVRLDLPRLDAIAALVGWDAET